MLIDTIIMMALFLFACACAFMLGKWTAAKQIDELWGLVDNLRTELQKEKEFSFREGMIYSRENPVRWGE